MLVQEDCKQTVRGEVPKGSDPAAGAVTREAGDPWDGSFRGLADFSAELTTSVLGSSSGRPCDSGAAWKKRRATLISSPLPRKTSTQVNKAATGKPDNCPMKKDQSLSLTVGSRVVKCSTGNEWHFRSHDSVFPAAGCYNAFHNQFGDDPVSPRISRDDGARARRFPYRCRRFARACWGFHPAVPGTGYSRLSGTGRGRHSG